MIVLRLLYKTIMHSYLFVIGFFFAVIIWALGDRYDAYRICVVLPNGLIIGREALFDPGLVFHREMASLDSNIILKSPDGSALIGDEIASIYVSETTVYGAAYVSGWSQETQAFAYRQDVGLVYNHGNPETYYRLESEAGKLLDILSGDQGGLAHGGVGYVYARLTKDQTYRRKSCHLNILPE